MQNSDKFVTNPYLPVQMAFFIEETNESVFIILKSCNKYDAKKLIEEKVKHSLISKITDDLIYLKKTRFLMRELQFISIQTTENEDEVVYRSYYQVK